MAAGGRSHFVARRGRAGASLAFLRLYGVTRGAAARRRLMAVPVLETRAITKRFPGVVALKGVDFQLEAGEIHALCGENGAGKSTLIKILGGIIGHAEYEGSLYVRGEPARFASIRDAEAAKIAVIYQELALVDAMTVAENVFLGHEPSRLGFVDHGRMYVETQRVLTRFHFDIDPTRRVADLGMGQ